MPWYSDSPKICPSPDPITNSYTILVIMHIIIHFVLQRMLSVHSQNIFTVSNLHSEDTLQKFDLTNLGVDKLQL